jgi:hypothetical protein
LVKIILPLILKSSRKKRVKLSATTTFTGNTYLEQYTAKDEMILIFKKSSRNQKVGDYVDYEEID